MGMISDLLGSAQTFQGAASSMGGDRVTRQQLRSILAEQGDFDYPSGYAARNEVQLIAIFAGSPDGGTFTLTFTLKSGETFTTAGIAFGANAGTIQTAINVAATAAAVVGWVNGHIVITGGPLTTTPLTITFSGASVASLNHSQTTINAASVTNGTAGAVSTTTHGQANRAAWGLLKMFDIVTSAPPAQGADLTSPTVNLVHGQFPHKLNADTVRQLVEEASFDDANATVKTALLTALGL